MMSLMSPRSFARKWDRIEDILDPYTILKMYTQVYIFNIHQNGLWAVEKTMTQRDHDLKIFIFSGFD